MGTKYHATQLVGVSVSTFDKITLLKEITRLIETKQHSSVCLLNVYSVFLYYTNKHFQGAVTAAEFVIIDGAPLAWLARFKRQKIGRIRGSELMLALCSLAQTHSWSNFFYGASPHIANELTMELKGKFPGLRVVGTYSPPLQPAGYREKNAVINHINEQRPHILWVGLGAPKQEIWMYDHKDNLNVSVTVGVGAAFDFLSGNIREAPRFIQKVGFEWLYRLLREPRRLWKRYVFGNAFFIVLVLLDMLRILPEAWNQKKDSRTVVLQTKEL